LEEEEEEKSERDESHYRERERRIRDFAEEAGEGTHEHTTDSS